MHRIATLAGILEKLTSILAIADGPAGIMVLDKAVRLARAFGARVELLVRNARFFEFATHCAGRSYEEVLLCSVPGEGESLDGLILRNAHSRRPDLVMTASGAHPLKRWSRDAYDRELASECPVPLVLVGPRPWAPLPRLGAAVDISDADTAAVARSILHTAGFLALGWGGFLDVLYSEREEFDEKLRLDRAVKLAQLVREYRVGSEQLQMFNGAPGEKLPPLIAARQYDLLVLGAVTHRVGPASWNASAWKGSLTSRLIESTAGDVVLVNASVAAQRRAAQKHDSRRQQSADLLEQIV
jgi:nucleotide-binding universal stress UspA family protein